MRIGIYARVSTKDQSCEMQIRDLRALCFAKTLAGTKSGAVLGGVGLNMIIASIQHEDSGGQEPERA